MKRVHFRALLILDSWFLVTWGGEWFIIFILAKTRGKLG